MCRAKKQGNGRIGHVFDWPVDEGIGEEQGRVSHYVDGESDLPFFEWRDGCEDLSGEMFSPMLICLLELESEVKVAWWSMQCIYNRP